MTLNKTNVIGGDWEGDRRSLLRTLRRLVRAVRRGRPIPAGAATALFDRLEWYALSSREGETAL